MTLSPAGERRGTLDEGTFADGCLRCPWHDSVFYLDDAAARHGPATQPRPRFDGRLRKGLLEVRLHRS